MSKINLSYIITTRNKLEYLKEVVSRLIINKKDDEEIIVIDAASTDGTNEYLQKLYDTKKVEQFISEPDIGEAHGFNKGILMSKGKFIKILTDDDTFDYESIKISKEFLLTHNHIDILTGNVGGLTIENPNKIVVFKSLQYNFLEWMNNQRSSTLFFGLPIMIRRSSISKIGLFHTGVKQIDNEYSFRVTKLKLKIAWNTRVSAIRIDNPKSILRHLIENNLLQDESSRIHYFYHDEYVQHVNNLLNWNYRRLLYELAVRPIRPIKNLLFRQKGNNMTDEEHSIINTDNNIACVMDACEIFMKSYNSSIKNEILY